MNNKSIDKEDSKDTIEIPKDQQEFTFTYIISGEIING